jgi:hypothetical protein
MVLTSSDESQDNTFDAEVTVTFILNDICNDSDLDEYNSFEELVRDLLESEGITGLIDNDDYIIQSIKKI